MDLIACVHVCMCVYACARACLPPCSSPEALAPSGRLHEAPKSRARPAVYVATACCRKASLGLASMRPRTWEGEAEGVCVRVLLWGQGLVRSRLCVGVPLGC